MRATMLIVFAALAVSSRVTYAQNLQLKFLQIVFRHGARSPLDFYPTDPNNGNWPQGPGQLTTLGMQQQYGLGGWMAARYQNFLGAQYVRTDVYYRSDDEDRTLMSAEAQLAGLFPPNTSQQFNSSLAWQPIPVHTVAIETDSLINTPPCPNYDAMLKSVMASDDVQSVAKQYAPLFAFLSANAGMQVNINNFDAVNDPTVSERAHQMPQPAWLTDSVFQQLSTLSALDWHWQFNNRTMTRYVTGVLVNSLLGNMYNMRLLSTSQDANVTALLSRRGRKLMAYSGHDTNIAALLHALNAWNYVAPPFASAMVFELLTDATSSAWFVNVLLRNSSFADAYPISIPGCGSPCPLEKFAQLLDDVNLKPENRPAECGASAQAAQSSAASSTATSTLSPTTASSSVPTSTIGRSSSSSPAPCTPTNGTYYVTVTQQGKEYVLTMTMTPLLWLCIIAVLSLVIVCFLSFISYVAYLCCCKKQREKKKADRASIRRHSSNKYNAERLLRNIDADAVDPEY